MTSAARRRRSSGAIRLADRSPVSAITPLSLLGSALDRGADAQILAQLIGLHERSRADEAHRAFEAALAAAKAELPIIAKTQIASIGTKHYRHEDLAEIARTISPVLARHGLAYRFRSQTEGELVTLTCVIAHRDGHSEESSLSAGADHSGEKNAIQAIGSALTYLQRMTLKAALGLAAAGLPRLKAVRDWRALIANRIRSSRFIIVSIISHRAPPSHDVAVSLHEQSNHR